MKLLEYSIADDFHSLHSQSSAEDIFHCFTKRFQYYFGSLCAEILLHDLGNLRSQYFTNYIAALKAQYAQYHLLNRAGDPEVQNIFAALHFRV